MHNLIKIFTVIILLSSVRANLYSQWVQCNADTDRIAAMAINDSGYVFIGTQATNQVGGHLSRTTDQGATWMSLPTGSPNDQFSSLIIAPNGYLMASTLPWCCGISDGSVFRSTNNGLDWSEIRNGISPSIGANCLSSDSNNIVYATGQGHFYRTTNFGDAWVERPSLQGSTYTTSVGPSGIVYAGSFHSHDGGESWHYPLVPFCCEIYASAVNSKGDVFIGAQVIQDKGGISRSTDHGQTWVQLFNGLTDRLAWAIIIDDHDNIYAGTDTGGIYLSKDNGNTWSSISGNIGTRRIRSLAIDRVRDLLYAGTEYKTSQRSCGVWRRDISDLVSSVDNTRSYPLACSLAQNFPNPFNPVTTIEYDISSAQRVRLIVYDLLGREVGILSNGHEKAGHHSIQWNAAGLSSGIYYYRLMAAEAIQTKMMVLIR